MTDDTCSVPFVSHRYFDDDAKTGSRFTSEQLLSEHVQLAMTADVSSVSQVGVHEVIRYQHHTHVTH